MSFCIQKQLIRYGSFFVATYMAPGKVYEPSNLKSFGKNSSIYYFKLHQLEQKNPRNSLFIVEYDGQCRMKIDSKIDSRSA